MSSLKVANLRIDRFLGVGHEREPIELLKGELSSGINVVYGANGSGKTTTARALTCLVWPDADRDEQPTLSGAFTCGDGTWNVRLDAGHARVSPAPPAGLPPTEHRDRYLLPLHDLLRARENDTRLAEVIQEEIYGGLNLGRAAQQLGLNNAVPRRTVGERRELDRAREHEEETRERQRHIREGEQHLGDLRARLRAAEDAARHAALLRAALDRHQAGKQREARDQHVRQLVAEQPGIDRYRPDDAATGQVSDLRTFQQIQATIADAARQHKEAIGRREHAVHAMKAAAFTDAPPPTTTMRELQEQARALGRQEDTIALALKTMDKARKAAEHADKEREQRREEAERLRLDLESREPAPDTQQLAELAQRHEDLKRLDERLAEYRRELVALREHAGRQEGASGKAVAALRREDAAHPLTPPPSQEDVTRLLDDAGTLAHLKQTMEAADRDVAGHRAMLDRERGAIGDNLTDEQLQALDSVRMDTFDGFLTELARLNGSREAINIVAAWAESGEPPPDTDVDTWQRAATYLEQWLFPPKQRRHPILIAAGAAALAAIAVGLAAWGHLAFLVILVAPGALLCWAARTQGDEAVRANVRRQYESDALPLCPPTPDGEAVPGEDDTWSETQVRARVNRFRQCLDDARWRARWVDGCRRHKATEERRLDERQRKMRERVENIRQCLGMRADVAPEGLQQLAGCVCRWQGARTELAGAEARREEARAQHAEIVNTAAAVLAAYGLPACADSNSLRTTAQRLDQVRQAGDSVRLAADALNTKLAETREGEEQRREALQAINAILTAFVPEPADSAASVAGSIGALRERRLREDEDRRNLARLGDALASLDRTIRESRREEETQRREAEQAGTEKARVLEQVNASVAELGEPPVATAEDARQCTESLTSRLESWRRAEAEAEQAEKEIARLDADIAEERERRRTLLERLDLEDDETATEHHLERLRELDNAHPRYREARTARDGAVTILADRDGALTSRGDYDAALRDITPEELRRQIDDAARQADEAEDVSKRIVEIEKSVRDARQGHDLGEAVFRRTQAEAALARKRDETFAAHAGHLLIEFLRQTNQARASAVLVRARERFARITANRYDLEVTDGDPPRFAARDTATSVVRALDELSSGTRVQLLIAVRLAFLEVQEGDRPKLPLILDEALGNTDDMRASEIIDAVIEVARTGRQVFYFTAQWDEVGKWRQRLESGSDSGDDDSVPFTVLELPASPPPEDQLVLPQTPPPQSVREPHDGESYEDYAAAIGVPRFDPWADAGHTHLWYLLDDGRVLHRFLSRELQHWGQLELLLNRAGDAALCTRGFTDDPDFGRETRSAARILSHVVALWRRGRGRPVTADVLAAEDSPCRNSKMLDDLIAAARSCAGDGEKLLESVRDIRGFGAARQNDLREYLEGHGFLGDRDQRLTPEELRTQLQVRLTQDLQAPDSPYATLPPSREQDLLRRTGLLES